MQRRANLIFFIVLALLLGMMTAQERQGGERTMLERFILKSVAWIPSSIHFVTNAWGDLWNGYADLRHVVSRNHELEMKLRRTELALQRYHAEAGLMERLGASVDYHRRSGHDAVFADVVFLDTGGWFKTLIADAGSDNGVRDNAPVVAGQGLVGRVVVTTPRMAKVQLLVDNAFSCGAVIRRNRQQGVVHGDGRQGATLGYVPKLSDVRTGDEVFTSGVDGIFPGGIFVGIVGEVRPGPELFKEIRVQPAVAFDRLDDVLIVKTAPLPAELERSR